MYPHTRDGKIIIPHVMHPGVVAKPYLAPAFESMEKEHIIEAIENSMKAALDATPDEIRITSEVLII